MKKFKFLSIAAVALMMLGSCSDDKLDGKGDEPGYKPSVDDGVHFSLIIDLPSGGRSRSTTTDPNGDGSSSSSSGVEIGQDYENEIKTVAVVLARSKDNGFIAAAPVAKEQIRSVVANKTAYQVTSSFSKTTLSEFYAKMDEQKDEEFSCNIFVFANPGDKINTILFGKTGVQDAPDLLSNAWVNGIAGALEKSTYLDVIANKTNGFLMSNAVMAERQIPESLVDWNYYTDEGNPFDLSGDNREVSIDNGTATRGAIKLERSAARFDFRDGSPLAVSENKPFTYHVVKENDVNAGGDQPVLIDIVLSNMSLVNVNKSFYALRRVSNNGRNVVTNTAGANNELAICGAEKRWIEEAIGEYSGGNYVVDADQVWKTQTANDFSTENPPTTVLYNSHFISPLLTNSGDVDTPTTTVNNWITEACSVVAGGTKDNDEGWTTPNGNYDYRIWTYATENTIAGYRNQKNGISTGVVFKGKMVATDYALGTATEGSNTTDPATIKLAEAIKNAGQNSPMLFLFGGNLYCGWDEIRNAAIASAVSGIKWVPDSETDKTKGKWEFTSVPNRSSSLYSAVFGTGGFGTVTFTYTEYEEGPDGTQTPVMENGVVVRRTGTITDTESVVDNCCDALWNVYVNTTNSTNKATALSNFKAAATSKTNKITIYETSQDKEDGWGYYCYYYYWNRHNDNGQDGVMGPMEFAVVRNNVYKLAVTNIKQLGHPRHSSNDPNKPTGGKDDESEEVYLSVTCEVLPWVVRVNDIEF